ncbi:MAG: FAD-dependent oxidoreductase [Planctomycetota bacterium]
MSESSPSVIVVGGGVIGLSIAWVLAGRGYQVRILEKSKIGQETSWSASGILPPARFNGSDESIDQLRGLSHQLYPKWAADLHQACGIDVQLDRVGGLYLATTPGELASLVGLASFWEEQGIASEIVGSLEVAEREPVLSAACDSGIVHSALWAPDEYQIRPPRLLKALHASGQSLGVQYVENVRVEELRLKAQCVELHAEQQIFEAEHAVFCVGAWSSLMPWETPGLEVRSVVPVRGQILRFETGKPLLQHVVNVGNRYVVARRDGVTLVGSCEQEAGMDQSLDPTVEQELLEFVRQIMPAMNRFDLADQWTGLRPMTYDGYPMIGSVDAQRRVWVAGGHYRSGIHLAPATAVCLADMLEGKAPPMPMDAFNPRA